ncbi:HTH-type transcriptional regulator Hpr [Pseudalkalibacillus decolorationis]|uniref:HTH-type transcriptional regulator Hpr n=1 Tax=Pseudalkalibacillus decolorationis TaxID=163879 RepID=UPI002148497A|nr:HTH-type transcriptional regulator Hpr [Pseudalkalibacillus decolorationis]
MENERDFSMKEAMMFSHKVAQVSKAMWKCVEKDWQSWIKPFGLNINEHHILWIAYQLEGASISDISKFGVMHVSTAFNFSKKLEVQGYLTFSKKENDKRNTYVKLTEDGRSLLLRTIEEYNPDEYGIFGASLKIRELYGKFPEFDELMAVIRSVYGSEFMAILDTTENKLNTEFEETDGHLSSTLKKVDLEKVLTP